MSTETTQSLRDRPQGPRHCDANTLLRQIGMNARMFIGLRKVYGLGDGIVGQVGIAGAQYLYVRLNASDLYDVEYCTIRKLPRSMERRVTVLAQEFDLFGDQLADALCRLSDGVLR